MLGSLYVLGNSGNARLLFFSGKSISCPASSTPASGSDERGPGSGGTGTVRTFLPELSQAVTYHLAHRQRGLLNRRDSEMGQGTNSQVATLTQFDTTIYYGQHKCTTAQYCPQAYAQLIKHHDPEIFASGTSPGSGLWLQPHIPASGISTCMSAGTECLVRKQAISTEDCLPSGAVKKNHPSNTQAKGEHLSHSLLAPSTHTRQGWQHVAEEGSTDSSERTFHPHPSWMSFCFLHKVRSRCYGTGF